MFSVTVIILSDMVESVILLNDEDCMKQTFIQLFNGTEDSKVFLIFDA